jgi:DNA mismatch repair ATPase MutS
MAERVGVVNLHLKVDMTENNMTMLYKVGDGFVKEKHYGLALARVVDLPPQVLKTVEKAEKTYFMDAVSGYLRRAEPALQSLIHPFKVIFAPGQMQVVSVRTATRLV